MFRSTHPPRAEGSRALWGWLALGGVLLLAAQHGHPAVAVAAWLSPVFLLRFARRARLGRMLLGLVIVHAVAGAVWTLSIQLPVDGVPLQAMAGVIVLNLFLMVPFLIDRLVAMRLRTRHPVLSTLVFPATRVVMELGILVVSPFGFVFGILASTQQEALALIQIASVTGMYGVSFLVAWLAPAVDELWRAGGRRAPLAVFGSALLAALVYGGLVLSMAPVESPTVRVAGVSPARGMIRCRRCRQTWA